MKKIYCYTDGSACVQGVNKGKGGFGVYFPDLFGIPKGLSRGYKNGKTGGMEVEALYHALSWMPFTYIEPVTLVVYSDSEYVVKTFTENRLEKWIMKGWRNSSGAVKNQTLWELIVINLKEKKYLTLEMRHIRSHQVEKEKDPIKKAALMKDPHIRGNMMADRLADYKRHKILY